MGYYTKFHLEGELNELGNREAAHIIQKLLDSPSDSDGWPDHQFFSLDRRHMLRSSSYYHLPFSTSFLREAGEGGLYFLFNCDLKNYEDEIELFLSWLAPYVDEAVGFSRGEGFDLSPIYIRFGKLLPSGDML